MVARNKVRLEVRRRLGTHKYDVRREGGIELDVADHEASPVEVVIAREQWNRLLHDQPEHYRQIIVLKLRGYTQQAIAEALELDETTVRRFLKRLVQVASP